MPEQLRTDTVGMEQRQALITALSCFAMLSPQESQALAALMVEMRYAPGEKIVIEDALVDSVFIITNGQAEVSRQFISKKPKLKLIKTTQQTTHVPLAVLGAGDAIGLNSTGFFSTTGKRTATVTALTAVTVLYLDLKQLHHFLQQHPQLQKAMYASAEQMLRVRLIKQSLPFSRLSHERLMWLASQVEIAHVPAGKIIFREGDKGDRCYLIRSGTVEIITQNENGAEHQLAALAPPILFGEATLITHAPRNATARAAEDCELFILKNEYLNELIESEKNVAKTFMTLMVDRSRPLQNPHVIAHQRVTMDGQTVVILKNSDNWQYFKLSAEGWYIWQQMDGKQTMREITLALANKYKIFAPDVVAALISKLAQAGFITQVEVMDGGAAVAGQPFWVRALLRVRHVLESRIAIGDADKWLTVIYQKGAHLIFSHLGKFLLTLLTLAGFFAFCFTTPYVIELFKTIHDSWILILILVPFTLLSVALHELGHALATKSYGQEVHYMGVGWYWLGPVAFTDTSDMWLSARGPRIFVNLAGVYTDVFIGGIAALGIFLLPSAHVQAFLWIFALFNYISAFRMLNPLQELDGYYVLMDLFDRPRLRQSAIVWLVKDFPKALRRPKLFRNFIPESCYWLACLIFIILVSIVTLLVQTVVFKILGFKPANVFISLALPVVVALVSSLGIIADIRSQAED